MHVKAKCNSCMEYNFVSDLLLTKTSFKLISAGAVMYFLVWSSTGMFPGIAS